jgi:hypothetical protein
MKTKDLRDILKEFPEESEICVSAVFPELDGWEVGSYALAVEPDPDSDGPQISLYIYGTDFDYPDPMRLIEEFALSIIARKGV